MAVADPWALYAEELRKKKKPPATAAAPKPVKSYDPYGALQDATNQLVSAHPDYSQIAPVDFESLQRAALTQAQQGAYQAGQPIQNERGYQQARQKASGEAATNFSKAFADILTGGKSGAEGEQYSLENFGGSYLAGIAARMGQQLISQQTDYFNEQDFKLAGQLADIMDSIPDEADKIYSDLVKSEQDRVDQGMSIADADYKTKIAALGAWIKNTRDNLKAQNGGSGSETTKVGGSLYEKDPKTGQWVLKIQAPTKGATSDGTQIVYVKGVPYYVDPVTRKSQPVVPGTGSAQGAATVDAGGGSTSAGKPISFSAASTYARSMTSNTGSLWKVRKTKNGFEAYDTGKPTADSGAGSGTTTSSGAKVYPKGTAYEILNGLSKARQASEIYKWKQFANGAAKGAIAGQVTYQAALKTIMDQGIPLDIAQNALNRYWKAGVLKPWEKDKPGEGRPVKSWQERNPGKVKAARVAANKLPKTVGGNVPVVNEAGRTVPKNVQTVLQLADKYLGVKYVWGGETPAGFDCSGFVRYLYKQVGIDPGGYTIAQWQNPNGIEIKSQSDLQPGDVVFFHWGTHPETGQQGPLHEGLYIGNGLFIQAPRTGDVVKVSKMSERSDFLGARRFVQTGVGA